MSQRTKNVTPNSGQDTLQQEDDSTSLTNLDEWRHTEMHPNNSGYKAQQRATPISNLYYNTTNHQNIQHQQVSQQNQSLSMHQQVHHQNFQQQLHHQRFQQQQLHQRSSRMMEQTPTFTSHANTLNPTPNTKQVLEMEAYIDSLRQIGCRIQGEKEKLLCDKQALVNKVESLESKLLEWQNSFDERDRCFKGMYGERTQEWQVTKEKLEVKSRCLEKMRVRVQRKDVQIEKIQNELKGVHIDLRKCKRVLKKLREMVTKRDDKINELKREKNELKSHVTNYEKECKKLKEDVSKLECSLALESERKEKLKKHFVKWINRHFKNQTEEIKWHMESRNNSCKAGKRSVESNSNQQECISSKMRKLDGNQVTQKSGGGGDTSEKLQRIKMKKEKWNIKNYLANEKDNFYQNNSSSTNDGEGIDGIEDSFCKETGENKNAHKKRVCSIAKTRLPQWKHLREPGASSLAKVGQGCEQIASDFRKK